MCQNQGLGFSRMMFLSAVAAASLATRGVCDDKQPIKVKASLAQSRTFAQGDSIKITADVINTIDAFIACDKYGQHSPWLWAELLREGRPETTWRPLLNIIPGQEIVGYSLLARSGHTDLWSSTPPFFRRHRSSRGSPRDGTSCAYIRRFGTLFWGNHPPTPSFAASLLCGR